MSENKSPKAATLPKGSSPKASSPKGSSPKASSPKESPTSAEDVEVLRLIFYQVTGGDVTAHVAEMEKSMDAELLQAYIHATHHALVTRGTVAGSQLSIYMTICHETKTTKNVCYTTDGEKKERLAKILDSPVETNRVVRELLQRAAGMSIRMIVVSMSKTKILGISTHLGAVDVSKFTKMIPIM
jgi:hypothetical protein